MSNFSRSPSSRGSAASPSNLTGTGRSSPVRGINHISQSARGSFKKPSSSMNRVNVTSTVPDDAQAADARAQQASLVDEFRQRVQKAETLSENYYRQLQHMESRLNDLLQEHGKLEDRLHEREEKLSKLEDQEKLAARQMRDMESEFDSERKAMLRDQLDQKAVEEELQAVNKRLKDSLAGRDLESRKTPVEPDRGDDNAFQASRRPSDPNENVREVAQKEKLIDSLRLELTESQIKIMELENVDGSRVQELEKTMLETRITNARLMEENESFQLLLSEKTLNGDFTKTEVMRPSLGLGSLAEELESAEGESENYRRLELEAKSLKDQNKALTIYIENIIGRLLSHKEFENVLEKSPDLMSSIAQPNAGLSAGKKDKELPPPPPEKENEAAPTLLQRAKSVVSGPRRPRPMSFMAPSTTSTPQADDDTSKDSSVPISRSQSGRQESHRRSQSEMPMAAPIVNQMYRGSPPTGSGGPLSPGISPGAGIARNSFFAPATGATSSNPTSRAASGSRFSQERPGSSSNSTYSDRSGEVSGKEKTKSGYTNYTGAVMTQNRLRPLRLVQENREMENGGNESAKADEVTARKKANRNSWMPGWFNRAKEDEAKGENSNFF
ncbi:MAG: hypothetical protein Q9216_005372 [Gyalolechia sp. 2 TL-2023]